MVLRSQPFLELVSDCLYFGRCAKVASLLVVAIEKCVETIGRKPAATFKDGEEWIINEDKDEEVLMLK